jgi:polysaccharide chain length determinant protein (PEP-CTERM system associated)
MHELADQVLLHLQGIWRYRWQAVVVAWVIAVGGWIAVYLTPDRYVAFARVYVDTQSVLRPLLTGLAVQPNLDQMVTMMTRTLISRPNVEKVIRMADMDIGLKSPEDHERLTSHVAGELAIRNAGRENLYTISYGDQNPQQAKRVVQSLLTLFVEGSLGDKRKDSDSARQFIDDQLKGYNEKLLAAESAIMEFKRRNLGLMPGEAGTYYARRAEAKTLLSQASLELREAENTRDAIRKQLAGEAGPMSAAGIKGAVESSNPDLDARIQALEQKLDGLRLNFTEQHPDIVAIVRIITQLNEQRNAEAKLAKPVLSATQAKDPVYQQLTISLTTAEANVAALTARVAEYSRRYSELQAAASAAPQVEAEYTQLTRDYDGTKARYDKLLERRESAQISGDMEASDGAMGFRVIDPPQVPLAPSAPNRPLLMTWVLLAALGGGLGVALMTSQIRPAFSDERRLREVSGLRVLGTVVMTWNDAQKARRTRALVAFLISFAGLLSAYAAIMAALVLAASRA